MDGKSVSLMIDPIETRGVDSCFTNVTESDHLWQEPG